MEGHHHFDQHPQPPHFANTQDQDPTLLAVRARPPTVKIVHHANERYCLSIRDGQVVIALANPLDSFQQWIKVTRHSTKVKDVEGRSAFVLVNKATGEVIKQSLGDKHPVCLVLFNPHDLDESVLWIESNNVRNGFRSNRLVNNISLTLDAHNGHDKVHDGTIVINWPCWNGENQIWKMVPCGYEAILNSIHSAPISLCTPSVPIVLGHHPRPLTTSSEPPTLKIFCGANEGYYLSIRDGKVILASANPRDPFQHWIKDMRHSTKVKDVEGRPAFALVNKATGEAIKHSLGEKNPVRLVPFNPHELDESMLWTESNDVRKGFKCIRMVNNISLTLDALGGHVEVHDGTIIFNWPCWNGENQIWKMVPYVDDIILNPIHYAPVSQYTPCVPIVYGQHPCSLSASSQPLTVKIFCRANEQYYLSIRDRKVVLASANPHDPFQHWIKETRHCTKVKDVEGNPSFALVNKATGEAIKQSLGDIHPVRLVPFNPHDLDESMLWTESNDVRDGFRCIRMVNNISLTLDVLNGHLQVNDGRIVINWPCWNADNQIWKMVPCGYEAIPNPIHSAPISLCTPCLPVVFGHHPRPLATSSEPPAIKIFCGANEGYYLTIRDGKVILASANPRDPFQHWIKDMRHGTKVKDVEGRPAFALVNKATGEAIKHSLGEKNPVRLVPFNPHELDESMLWTESNDVRNGFRCIRMVNNISLTLDALGGHVEVHDGTIIFNWPCWNGENQIWKMVPYVDDIILNPIHYAPVSQYTPCVPIVYGQHPCSLSASSQPLTVKIFCRANEQYYLSIRDRKVVLASANPHDPFQHWIKETRHCTKVKDVEGNPSFALVNKATGEAIKQSLGDIHPVRLVPFNPHDLDESMLWTESNDVRDGFRCIRMVNNISLTLDVLNGHLQVNDGRIVINWPCWNADNQIWKMVPCGYDAIPNPIHVALCRL